MLASYWKSQPRRFCEVCKCWTADNKASIEFHERGKSHKEKKEKQLTEMRKKSLQQHAVNQKAASYLQQMEAAAMKKYVQDLKESGVDVKKALGSNAAAEKAWKERKTSTGRVYYWNSITEETSWEKPQSMKNNDAAKEEKKTKVKKEIVKPETIEKAVPTTTTAPTASQPYGGWMTVEKPDSATGESESVQVLQAAKTEPRKITFKERDMPQSDSSEPSQQIAFKKRKVDASNKKRNIRTKIDS